MKKLTIAEKPSLARSIVSALSSAGEEFSNRNLENDKNAYFESASHVVTSVFGHILELKLFEEYSQNEDKNMWNLNELPYFPSHYEYKVKDDAKDRFNTIKELLDRDDIDEVIHCGVPDREGQVLVDIVLEKLGCKQRVTRPMLKTLTDEAILEAFQSREPNDNFTNWRKEGLLRSFIDYDYGFNLSRYATQKTKANPALNVGRVIGAIVTEVYDREMAIKHFIPVDFFKAAYESDALKLVSKKKFSVEEKEKADEYVSLLNAQDVTVSSVKKKQVEKASPKLFSQTALQAAMNKQYGKRPDETLKLSQSLYEKGITSYPRTNTEYLTTGDKEKVQNVIGSLRDSELIFKDKKRIFDDSKIEGHSAIIPTGKEPHDLTADETLCYNLVLSCFKAVFCSEKCIFDQTVATIDAGDIESFEIKGESIVTEGWMKYEGVKRDTLIPSLREGQKLDIRFELKKYQTKPPKSYTVTTLGKWMENPFRKEGETEDEEYKKILAGLEIGTEATRAGILSKALDKKYIYIEEKKKQSVYKIGERGCFLVESCRNLGIDMSKEKTAEMGKMLKDVFYGRQDPKKVLALARNDISKIISEDRNTKTDPNAEKHSAAGPEILGRCPKCGEDIVNGKYGAFCKGKCGIALQKFRGKDLTVSQIKRLLSGKEVLIKGLKKKNGTGTYDIYISLTNKFNEYKTKKGNTMYFVDFKTRFPDKKK